MPSIRTTTALSSIVAVMLVLVGCATDGDASPTPDATSASPSASADASPSTPTSAAPDGDAQAGAWSYDSTGEGESAVHSASIVADDGDTVLRFSASDLGGRQLRLEGNTLPDCDAGCTVLLTIDGTNLESRATPPEGGGALGIRDERDIFDAVINATSLVLVIAPGESNETRFTFEVAGLDPENIEGF